MKFSINLQSLKAASYFMAPKREVRTHLQGVRIEVATGSVTMVASNGAAILVARDVSNAIKTRDEIAFIIPSEHVSVILKGHSGCFDLAVSESNVSFNLNGASITLPRKGSYYPAWRDIMRKNIVASDDASVPKRWIDIKHLVPLRAACAATRNANESPESVKECASGATLYVIDSGRMVAVILPLKGPTFDPPLKSYSFAI